MPDYTDAAAVAAHLGRTFTAAQTTEANALIPAATAWINGRLGTSYPQTSLITDELHTVEGPLVYLRNAPISSVSAVKLRSPYVGASDTTLTAGAGYEMADASRGVLRLASPIAGYVVKVTYTPAVPTDSRLSLAAKKLVAFWMRPILDGASGDIAEYSVGQELRVRYRDPAASLGVPDEVVDLVESVNPSAWVFA